MAVSSERIPNRQILFRFRRQAFVKLLLLGNTEAEGSYHAVRKAFTVSNGPVSSGKINTDNVWSAARLQEKSVGEKTSLRKCIRP
jgi:hypothetical protein